MWVVYGRGQVFVVVSFQKKWMSSPDWRIQEEKGEVRPRCRTMTTTTTTCFAFELVYLGKTKSLSSTGGEAEQ